ncbi:MAG: hypothetical protein EXS03_08255 [Phycisphaerales bacterium]|nr:hypothetical protein [Phycisphaerales bacterium]
MTELIGQRGEFAPDGPLNEIAFVVGAASVFFALLFLWLGLRQFRKRAILHTMPTTPIAGVFVGDVEIKGVATSPQPVTGFLSGAPCVRYSWGVREHWTRTRQVRRTDSKGNVSHHTETYSGASTVASGSEEALLEVEDPTGRILVHTDGAQIDNQPTFEERVGQDAPLYYDKGPRTMVPGSDGIRTFSEEGITIGVPLYVVGYARERADVVACEIASGGRPGSATSGARARMFLISTRTEGAVASGHGAWGWGLLILGALCMLGLFFVEATFFYRPGAPGVPWTVVGGLLGYFGIFAGAWFVSTYNELIDLRNRVVRASSNIDVQLKRRADLIRNLVRCAAALRDYEATIQKYIAFLRAQAALENRGSASGRAQPALPVIRALVEHYPDLRAGEAFMRLQEELSESEHRIALARDEFNGVATGYNTRIVQFPTRMAAGLALMRRANFFKAESFERAVPPVSAPPATPH